MADDSKVGEVEQVKVEEAAAAEPDYKAELEQIRKEKADRERELAQAQFTIKKLKQKKEEHVETETEEEAEAVDVAEIISREVDRVRADLTVNVLEEELGKLTRNPDLVELTRHHYESSIAKSGATRAAIAEDLRKALAIANAKTLAKVASESSHAEESAAATSTGYAGSQRSDRSSEDLSTQERAEISAIAQRLGMSVDRVTQTFLANRRNAR